MPQALFEWKKDVPDQRLIIINWEQIVKFRKSYNIFKNVKKYIYIYIYIYMNIYIYNKKMQKCKRDVENT